MTKEKKWRHVHIDDIAYPYIVRGNSVVIKFNNEYITVDGYTLNDLDPDKDFDFDFSPSLNPGTVKDYIGKHLLKQGDDGFVKMHFEECDYYKSKGFKPCTMDCCMLD